MMHVITHLFDDLKSLKGLLTIRVSELPERIGPPPDTTVYVRVNGPRMGERFLQGFVREVAPDRSVVMVRIASSQRAMWFAAADVHLVVMA